MISQRLAPRKIIASLLGVAAMSVGLGAPGTSTTTANAATRIPESARTAIEHVQDRHARFGVTEADVARLRVTDVYRSTHTGVSHVYLRQTVDSITVARANMTVNVLPTGKILSARSRFIGDLGSKASGSVEIDQLEAARRAADHLGLATDTAPTLKQTIDSPEKNSQIDWPGVSISSIPAKLAYYPVGDDRVRLAWEVQIEETTEEHWWQIAIDAETGDVLSQVDFVNQHADEAELAHQHEAAVAAERAKSADKAKYKVFALPIESPNEGDRKVRQDPADEKASPFGWHDTDGKPGHEFTITRGNNAHAYADYTPGANTPLPTMSAEGGDSLNFDFELDFSEPPHLWRDAAVTNLFYWNNIIHDVTFGYGFNEPAGNFQTTNYTKKGEEADYVQAEAHDGQGVNNANFATPPDGSRPRMQMFLWPNTPKRQVIDGDLDAGVIVHEYGHGISNRLTGGPSEASCLRNQEQAGEGWSDWLALAITARSKSEIDKPRGLGTYVLGQEDRHQKGIRPTPYSPDTAINPATYDTIKGAAVPHGVGYVWGTMLWEVYVDLVQKYGFNEDIYGDWRSGGNNLAMQLVLDGMKMQPCEPGFIDSRDGIFDADKALTGGKNRCLLWRAFAKRGLGVGAEQGESTNRADGTEDFSIPKDC